MVNQYMPQSNEVTKLTKKYLTIKLLVVTLIAVSFIIGETKHYYNLTTYDVLNNYFSNTLIVLPFMFFSLFFIYAISTSTFGSQITFRQSLNISLTVFAIFFSGYLLSTITMISAIGLTFEVKFITLLGSIGFMYLTFRGSKYNIGGIQSLSATILSILGIMVINLIPFVFLFVMSART